MMRPLKTYSKSTAKTVRFLGPSANGISAMKPKRSAFPFIAAAFLLFLFAAAIYGTGQLIMFRTQNTHAEGVIASCN